jgi:hypothetical protein
MQFDGLKRRMQFDGLKSLLDGPLQFEIFRVTNSLFPLPAQRRDSEKTDSRNTLKTVAKILYIS